MTRFAPPEPVSRSSLQRCALTRYPRASSRARLPISCLRRSADQRVRRDASPRGVRSDRDGVYLHGSGRGDNNVVLACHEFAMSRPRSDRHQGILGTIRRELIGEQKDRFLLNREVATDKLQLKTETSRDRPHITTDSKQRSSCARLLEVSSQILEQRADLSLLPGERSITAVR